MDQCSPKPRKDLLDEASQDLMEDDQEKDGTHNSMLTATSTKLEQ